jgi:MarR family transcriptional regulator, transcriptional regulator for hemolysin
MIRNHELFHSIHQLSRKLTKHINEVLQPYGLFSAQWSVIYVLKTKGVLTQKELSDYLCVEAPPMTRTIQRLVKQGFVQQIVGEDKRKKHIQLTMKALDEYPIWERAVLELNDSLLQSIPKSPREDLLYIISKWLPEI